MSTINNAPDNSDMARGVTTVGIRDGVAPLFIGAAQIVADSAPAKALFAKYELAALEADGVAKFVPGTHNASQAVVVSQPITVIGQAAPYWNEGYFNHEAIVWPAGIALDTYVERKAFFTGTNLRVGHTI
jgi:hypothetical protein